MAQINEGQSAFSKLKKLSNVHLFESVKVFPEHVGFDGQDQEEQVVLFLRQHPVVLIPGILKTLVIMFLAFLVSYVFDQTFTLLNIPRPLALSSIIVFLGLAVAVSSLILTFVSWFYNVFIITSQRIVDLDFNSLFDARWSGASLASVEDVSHSTPGFVSALFDMGTLNIQTAAEQREFEIANIPKPRDVQDVLLDLVENAKRE